MKTYFSETQRFTQWWLWLILIGITSIPVIGIYQQIFMKQPFGDNPMSNVGLIVFAVFILLILALFRWMKLEITMDDEGIKMKFYPFTSKNIKWSEIKSAELVKYGFVGYGIRYGSKYGVVYNTKGREGIAIETKSGAKLVIGTQLKNEVNSILHKLLNKN